MRQNPERLAWAILLTAFGIFCLIIVGCPLSVRSYLLNARQPLHAQVNSQRGTVWVERGGGSRADATSMDDPPLELFEGHGVRTGTLDEGLLTLQRGPEGSRETLVSVVVYDNSDVVLKGASAPRFGFSSAPHKASLQIKRGRVRIEIQPAADGRPVQTEVRTDQARIQLSEGSYALQVTNQQTTATVRNGQASVRAGDEELTLSTEQRAVISLAGELDGPLPAEYNLVANGDFSQGLDNVWIVHPTDPSARVSSASDDDGRPVARFQHDQVQPSEIGLVQTLNRNVRDLEALVLHLRIYVNFHSLSVCGTLGSECPVMVRIDYLDVTGRNRQWVHGFYAFDDPGINSELYYCLTCPEPGSGNHTRVPEKTWFLYDSPNLMEIDPEFRPATIQSVRIYASGHSYESMVTGVELLAQD